MTGNFYSLMNYDTLSTHPWNSMNLHMNQSATHMQVYPNLFSVPQYNFNDFIPYGGYNSNSYLTDPMYTIKQCSWGTPAWNNNMWNMSFNNANSWTPWNNGWNTPSNNSSNSDDPKQIEYQEKYNKLLSLAKQLEKYDGLSNEERRTLSAAIKDTKGTYEERFGKLSKAYKSISKDTVRTFLAEEGAGLAVIDPSTSSGKDTSKNNFYSRLTNAGFEYKNTTTDDEVENFYNGLQNELKDNDGNSSTAAGVIAKVGVSIDVLDFLSSYNSTYKNGDSSKGIIQHISNNWSKVKGEMKTTVSTTIINPLVKALVSKAQEVKKSLDEDSQEVITKAIEDLETAKSKSTTSVDSNLSKAFDKLYLLTRNGAMEKLKNDAISYYGEVDPDIFNNELFDSEYKKDLKEEGFTESEIRNAEVTLSDKEAKKTKKSPSSDASEEVDDVEGTSEEKEKKKAKPKAEETTEEYDPISSGQRVGQLLEGWTTDEDAQEIANRLSCLDNDSIAKFLHGYYKESGDDREGLMEFLDDDTSSDIVTIDVKRGIIEKALAKAEELGLNNNNSYKELKKLYSDWVNIHSNGAKDFNQEQKDDWWWFNYTNYNEAFDEQLKQLSAAMSQKLGLT